jgi:hypothetical protein
MVNLEKHTFTHLDIFRKVGLAKNGETSGTYAGYQNDHLTVLYDNTVSVFLISSCNSFYILRMKKNSLKDQLFAFHTCQRPYHVEHTSSRPITEVKQHWARIVLGWETAWEHRVLLAFYNYLVSIKLY